MSAVCIKRTPCDPFRLEDKVCSVCQMVHDETQRDKINYRAWATNMIDFLRFKGIEHEFTDWCGGWQYPGKALEGTSDPAQPSREECAKVADDFAAYEQTVIDRAHADDALSETGRKTIVAAAGARQVAAEQIAHDIRALAVPSTEGK